MTNKTILYLHGLGGSSKDSGVEILKKKYDIIAPALDYQSKKMWKHTNELIDKLKPIAIIGHSLGGYMAYYLSNKHKIPALMFNPAFNDADLVLIPIPEDVIEMPTYDHQISIVGKEDDVINPNDQINALKSGNENANIQIEDIGHDIPENIFNSYSIKFR